MVEPGDRDGQAVTGTPAVPPGIWTPARLDVAGWLRQISPGLEEIYCSLVELLDGPALRGKTRLVGHCVRELGNGLLNLKVEAFGRIDYVAELDAIAAEWDQGAFSPAATAGQTAGSAIPSSTEISVSRTVAEKIDALVRSHSERKGANVARVHRFFLSLQLSGTVGDAQLEILAKSWHQLLTLFVRIAHNPKTDADVPEDFFTKVREFEESLVAFARAPKFFEGIEDIDAILAEANGSTG